jgi:hypothetical protein
MAEGIGIAEMEVLAQQDAEAWEWAFIQAAIASFRVQILACCPNPLGPASEDSGHIGPVDVPVDAVVPGTGEFEPELASHDLKRGAGRTTARGWCCNLSVSAAPIAGDLGILGLTPWLGADGVILP